MLLVECAVAEYLREGAWAEPFHFSTASLGVNFSDDIESGNGNWTHAATQGTDHWVIATDQSQAPPSLVCA